MIGLISPIPIRINPFLDLMWNWFVTTCRTGLAGIWYVVITVGCAASLSCEQSVVLPRLGSDASEASRLLGAPSRIEKRPAELVEVYARKLLGCSGETLKSVVTVWTYERRFHRDVVIA